MHGYWSCEGSSLNLDLGRSALGAGTSCGTHLREIDTGVANVMLLMDG